MNADYPVIGILGGMGPAATADLLAKIVTETAAPTDQDNIPLVLWCDPRIPCRSTSIADASAPSPQKALELGAARLAELGAKAIAMACNTAHHWSAEVSQASGLPLIHIADAALNELERRAATGREQDDMQIASGGQARQIPRACLLATSGTLQSGFYRHSARRRNIELMSPEPADQARIDDVIRLVKANRLAEAREGFHALLATLRQQGAGAFVLACTELPLLVSDAEQEGFIDATQALARSIVDYARSERMA